MSSYCKACCQDVVNFQGVGWEGAVLGVLDHFATEGGDAGRDFQAGHAANGGPCEAVDTVGADLQQGQR